MAICIGRRQFITALGGAAVAWPLAARAQGARAEKRIALLTPGRESDPTAQRVVSALPQRLEELGWHVTKNLVMTVRWGASDPTRAAQLAAEIINTAPDVILASNAISLVALRPLAGSIPIVFVQVPDPVGMGFVASFAHPGGTITGFTNYEPSIAGKQLQLLRQIAPRVRQVGVLLDPRDITNILYLPALKEAGPSADVTVAELPVPDDTEIDSVLAAFAAKPGCGLFVLPGPFALNHRERITTAIQLVSLPAMYWDRSFTALGGLASYGIDVADNYRRAAEYVDRILRGAKPADLPVQTPTKYDFVINLKTANTLGLTVSPGLLSIADELIE